jgi:hypothetical protein
MKYLICQIEAITDVVKKGDERDIQNVMDALWIARASLQGELYGRRQDPSALAQRLIAGIEERRTLEQLEAERLYPAEEFYDPSR